MSMERRRGRDGGGIVIGIILLAIGGYYLLQNTFGFDLPELDWSMLWPVLLLGLGALILVRALMRRDAGGPQA